MDPSQSFLLNHTKTLVNTTPVGRYVVAILVGFFAFLWIANPGNKLIVIAFFALAAILWLKLKDLPLSLVVSYFASWVILTGKTYTIQLFESPDLPVLLYPQGYVLHLTIGPKHVLAFVLLLLFIRHALTHKVRIRPPDFLFLSLFGWQLLSALFGSLRPEISLPLTVAAFHPLAAYAVLRLYRTKKLLPVILPTLAALLIIESAIALIQLREGSPIYKNLEAVVNIEYFGQAADEISFRFRPQGTFDHANFLAAFAVVTALLLTPTLFQKKSSLVISAIAVAIVSVLISLSRGAWLGGILGLGVTLSLLRPYWPRVKLPSFNPLVGVLITLPLLGLFVLPRLLASFESFGQNAGGGYFRALQTEATLNLIANHPIFGAGPGMSVLQSISENPTSIFAKAPLPIHNHYLFVAAEHGLPYLVLEVMLFFVVVKSIRRRLSSATTPLLAAGLGGGILTVVVIGLVQPFMLVDLIMLYYSISKASTYEN